MAVFPEKLYPFLTELDEESACLVILNNVKGLSSELRQELRKRLSTQDEGVISELLEFREHLNPKNLISGLEKIVSIEKENAALSTRAPSPEKSWFSARKASEEPKLRPKETNIFCVKEIIQFGALCCSKDQKDSNYSLFNNKPEAPPSENSFEPKIIQTIERKRN